MKKIAKIEVVDPGSQPDVDSDFNTQVREKAVNYVTDLYGNTASIITFGTNAAKKALKAMCTIYEVPFAQANKAASLIPGPQDGVDLTLKDLFDPDHDRYAEGADFRNEVSGKEWENIIQSAMAIEGRNDSIGVHACGVIISSRDLKDVAPMHVRQKDGLTISQWKYPELEAIGLTKMDFLGLDTVDIIQNTVQHIIDAGKEPPNMLDVIHGEMNDQKTLELFQKGETIGVFQMSGDGVRDLLKAMKPDRVDDIIATTALYRPGPMGMNTHMKYVHRKNGTEKIEYPIHPDFRGSALENILGKTYMLVVYQEQILRIANEVAGMTLQEGDDLRKAMGKKKMDVMDKMKPKFFSGSKANGFSEDAISVLWDTLAEFAKYGFNNSHSVAYGMTAYQCAYLKANYPTEFMAALISQFSGKPDKTLENLKEARRMGLKVGPIDVNKSGVHVSPAYTGKYDIVFGFAGAKAVSELMAKKIVEERETNGDFTNVGDFVTRVHKESVKKSVIENIALGGGFDSFGVSRKGVVEALPKLVANAKTKETKGMSLFDQFGSSSEQASTIVAIDEKEYSHEEKFKLEAEMFRFYLSGHPLSETKNGLSRSETVSVKDLLRTTTRKGTYTVVGAIIDLDVKSTRAGKMVSVTIDDGFSPNFLSARFSKNVVQSIDKRNARDRIIDLYSKGEQNISEDLLKTATLPGVQPIPSVEKNSLYLIRINYRPGFEDRPSYASVESIRPLTLSESGKLPYRVRVRTATKAQDLRDLKALAQQFPGDTDLFVAEWQGPEIRQPDADDVFRYVVQKSQKDNGESRVWPPSEVRPKMQRFSTSEWDKSESALVESIDSGLRYKNTGLKIDTNQTAHSAFLERFGFDCVDFGIATKEMLGE